MANVEQFYSAHGEEGGPSLPGGQTYFAPAERRTGNELHKDLDAIANNPLIDGLMSVANSLFAVLNDKRQVIALNDAFLKLMGIEDVEEALGLRPGEYVNCVHACEMPGGCGTSPYCSTCGAVVSILAAMESGHPQERTCALAVEKDNQKADLFFSVRSCPVNIEGKMFVLFFLQDISLQQHRAYLERSFFHDINNILCALTLKSERLLMSSHTSPERLQELNGIVQRIAQEISIQNHLQKTLKDSYQPLYTEIQVSKVLAEIEQIFHDHPLAVKRTLEVLFPPCELPLVTDFHLASRIVINMVTNALEATPEHGTVRVFVEPGQNSVTFCVWNAGVIPEDIAKRIFQRNFSTKNTLGRGLGTYSMKLFGEQVLGGVVGFESSENKGTTFRFTLISASAPQLSQAALD